MWIYEGKEIKCMDDIPEEFKESYGFIYNIVTSEGREYIGKKNLSIKNSRVIGKRELANHPDKRTLRKYKSKKGKKKGEWVYYEERYKDSGWVEYTGSSEELNKDIEKGVGITKYILEFVEKESLMSYKEAKAIFCTNALEEEKFYNSHCDKRYFKKNIIDKGKIQRNKKKK